MSGFYHLDEKHITGRRGQGTPHDLIMLNKLAL